MNIDNIRTTIESIRSSKTFKQDTFDHDCGTPGCIVGHAIVNAGLDLNYVAIVPGAITTEVCKWFGISRDLVGELFYGYPDTEDDPIVKEQAIAVLENLIETGEVDWDITEEGYYDEY